MNNTTKFSRHLHKLFFVFYILISLFMTLRSYASGDIKTDPVADSSANINELSGAGIKISGASGTDTVTLSITVQGDTHTYTSNPSTIPPTSFPIDSTTPVTVTITHKTSTATCTDKPINYQVKSQTPTAPLVFVSGTANANGNGAAFTFTVNDQNKKPIKSASTLWLFESTPAEDVYLVDSSGHNVVGPLHFDAVNNVEAHKGTDSAGNITDTPVQSLDPANVQRESVLLC